MSRTEPVRGALAFWVITALGLSAPAFAKDDPPANPHVRLQPDGSTKDLSTGFVCPPGLEASSVSWAMVCSEFFVSPTDAASLAIGATATRIDLVDFLTDGISQGPIDAFLDEPSSAFPSEVTIAGHSAKVRFFAYVIKKPGDFIRRMGLEFVVGDTLISAQVQGFGDEAASRADLDAAARKIFGEWQTFAAANTAEPAPEPVDPVAMTNFIVQRSSTAAHLFTATAAGAVHVKSGFLCPLVLGEKEKHRLSAVLGNKDFDRVKCEYESTVNLIDLEIGPSPTRPSDGCTEAASAATPIVLHGETLTPFALHCARSANRDLTYREAKGDHLSVWSTTQMLNLERVPADRREAAQPLLAGLPLADRAAMDSLGTAFWDAVVATSASAH